MHVFTAANGAPGILGPSPRNISVNHDMQVSQSCIFLKFQHCDEFRRDVMLTPEINTQLRPALADARYRADLNFYARGAGTWDLLIFAQFEVPVENFRFALAHDLFRIKCEREKSRQPMPGNRLQNAAAIKVCATRTATTAIPAPAISPTIFAVLTRSNSPHGPSAAMSLPTIR